MCSAKCTSNYVDGGAPITVLYISKTVPSWAKNYPPFSHTMRSQTPQITVCKKRSSYSDSRYAPASDEPGGQSVGLDPVRPHRAAQRWRLGFGWFWCQLTDPGRCVMCSCDINRGRKLPPPPAVLLPSGLRHPAATTSRRDHKPQYY